MSRGRPPSVPQSDIVDAVLRRSKTIILSDGSIATKLHLVWIELSNDLGNKLSAGSIYPYVVDDLLQLKEKLMNQENINESANFTNTTNHNATDLNQSQDDESKSSTDNDSDVDIIRNYTLVFSAEEFSAMITERTRKCKGRNKKRTILRRYKAFIPGVWEDII